MDKTLFIGNGLNRTLESGISWNQLMAKLGSTEPEGSDVPAPIEFEIIAAAKGLTLGRKKNDPYKELKQQIADLTSSEDALPNKTHCAFKHLPFNHFITTNYDSVFEKLYDEKTLIPTNVGSTRNLLGPIYRTERADFYHAHGFHKWKNTICLGHDHYASLIGKIRSKFYPTEDETETITKLVTNQMGSLEIWPEYLLTNNVSIVGLGLDYSESDLWWLLSLRASVFAECNRISEHANRITYYKTEIEGEKLTIQESCRLRALEKLGVEVKRVSAKDYPEAYQKTARQIEEDWNA